MAQLRMYFDPLYHSKQQNLVENSINQKNQTYNVSRESQINSHILQCKVILFIDILKVVLFILLIKNQTLQQELNTANLVTWCVFVALLAVADGIVKLQNIKKSSQKLEQNQRVNQPSIQCLEDSPSASFIQYSVQNDLTEEIDFVQAIKSMDRYTIKKYFQVQFKNTENTISFLTSATQVFLLFVGLFVIYSAGDLKQTFQYKVGFVYLFTGFLVFCLPILNLIIFMLCLPIIILGSLFQTKQNSDQQAELKNIVRITVDEENLQTVFSKNDCSICFVRYKLGDQVFRLSCSKNHIFHSECIQRWFKVNNICPDCKQNVKESAIELMPTQRTTQIDTEQRF
ncbi:RING finger protein (macronuclear) [Tetrahymena thermophila SB210]|uniref:RING finger protein n=1 Tax=Tetrahymena thermophila (strain SB210) TaxID=312017 RepID=Q22TJ4_TETTS|nr:RING finger protein [Tetrahymena thermophila SB210]EAR88444.2 RING finger protein [Tetrahymena thermophila SB210]|eukprot:XP_001008689.2 RING finger protein [Tetrahymena thermophila SB210]